MHYRDKDKLKDSSYKTFYKCSFTIYKCKVLYYTLMNIFNTCFYLHVRVEEGFTRKSSQHTF